MNLSIVILTCNQAALTLRCLDSLSAYMEGHADAEVVLVDNGSADGTLARVADRHYRWSERLVTRYLETNRGVAAGRNVGLHAARGRVLMILDNDTVVTAGAVEALVGYVLSHTEAGVVAPRLVSPQGVVQGSAKPFPGLMVKIRNVLSHSSPEMPEMPDGLSAIEPYYVIGACQVFRREVLDRVGPLDEKIFYGPEDADFCARVRGEGYKIIYLPSITIVHDWQRATTRRVLSPLGRRHIRALLYFYVKHRRVF